MLTLGAIVCWNRDGSCAISILALRIKPKLYPEKTYQSSGARHVGSTSECGPKLYPYLSENHDLPCSTAFQLDSPAADITYFAERFDLVHPLGLASQRTDGTLARSVAGPPSTDCVHQWWLRRRTKLRGMPYGRISALAGFPTCEGHAACYRIECAR